MADTATPARAPANTRHGDVAVSDGVRIHYMEAGAGIPVVLLHGYTSSTEGSGFSNGIAQELAKDHRVIGIDARGHGQSEKPHEPEKYGGDRMIRDVLEVMDALGVKKAHIHGYSMGGMMTSQLMEAAPERFITAGFGGSGVGEKDEAARAKAAELDPKGEDPEQASALNNLQGRAGRDEEALKAVRAGRQAKPGVGLQDLGRIAFPVIAINGEFDRPHSKTVRMKRELKNFKAVMLPGKAHNTAIQPAYIPRLYIDEMAAFIRANDPK